MCQTMCDHIKDIKFLETQYLKAIESDIEIIEVEFASGNSRFRDRWSVGRIIEETAKNIERIKAEKEKQERENHN